MSDKDAPKTTNPRYEALLATLIVLRNKYSNSLVQVRALIEDLNKKIYIYSERQKELASKHISNLPVVSQQANEDVNSIRRNVFSYLHKIERSILEELRSSCKHRKYVDIESVDNLKEKLGIDYDVLFLINNPVPYKLNPVFYLFSKYSLKSKSILYLQPFPNELDEKLEEIFENDSTNPYSICRVGSSDKDIWLIKKIVYKGLKERCKHSIQRLHTIKYNVEPEGFCDGFWRRPSAFEKLGKTQILIIDNCFGYWTKSFSDPKNVFGWEYLLEKKISTRTHKDPKCYIFGTIVQENAPLINYFGITAEDKVRYVNISNSNKIVKALYINVAKVFSQE